MILCKKKGRPDPKREIEREKKASHHQPRGEKRPGVRCRFSWKNCLDFIAGLTKREGEELAETGRVGKKEDALPFNSSRHEKGERPP